MGLNNRLKKIESATEDRRVDVGKLKLYDHLGTQIDGEVVTMPTAESEGLARLADGSERQIVYEDNWENKPAIFHRDSEGKELLITPENCGFPGYHPKEYYRGKLVIRKSDFNALICLHVNPETDISKLNRR